MRDSLIVVFVFAAGCLVGAEGWLTMDSFGQLGSRLPLYALFLLIFLAGVCIGSNPDLKRMKGSLTPKLLLLPLSTITGTLAFSALASLVISRWSVADCMAVGSGMGYYSLSSVLISQLKEAGDGVQAASELGAIALLTNIIREFLTLVFTPLMVKLSPFAPISSAGATGMDVTLPVLLKNCGEHRLPAILVNAVLTDFSVPFLVTFFCSL